MKTAKQEPFRRGLTQRMTKLTDELSAKTKN